MRSGRGTRTCWLKHLALTVKPGAVAAKAYALQAVWLILDLWMFALRNATKDHQPDADCSWSALRAHLPGLPEAPGDEPVTFTDICTAAVQAPHDNTNPWWRSRNTLLRIAEAAQLARAPDAASDDDDEAGDAGVSAKAADDAALPPTDLGGMAAGMGADAGAVSGAALGSDADVDHAAADHDAHATGGVVVVTADTDGMTGAGNADTSRATARDDTESAEGDAEDDSVDVPEADANTVDGVAAGGLMACAGPADPAAHAGDARADQGNVACGWAAINSTAAASVSPVPARLFAVTDSAAAEASAGNTTVIDEGEDETLGAPHPLAAPPVKCPDLA